MGEARGCQIRELSVEVGQKRCQFGKSFVRKAREEKYSVGKRKEWKKIHQLSMGVLICGFHPTIEEGLQCDWEDMCSR
jgi:hypothetical protein